jgi:cystathionine beta-lyase/cystathionine gamma-synthase
MTSGSVPSGAADASGLPDQDAREQPPRIATRAIRSGRQAAGDSLAPGLYPSTTYTIDSVDGHAALARQARSTKYYSRFGSPTVRDFEDAVAELEGAEAGLAFASGMAAVSSVVLGLCSAGDHVVASRQLFSVTSMLFAAHLPRLGIEVTLVDGTDPADVAAAVRPGKTQLVFVETPANPALSLVDIEAVAAIPGPLTVVDSTFATPVVQQPLELGADLVLHAATKGLAGHNDALLGVIAGEREIVDTVWAFHGAAGAQASPFDAWNGIRGLRTLPVRVTHQAASAHQLAVALAKHPAVASVSYPGLDDHPQRSLAERQMKSGGTLLTLEVDGGAEAARRFCDSCRMAQIALSLGGPETLLTHPATIAGQLTPDERAAIGITDGMVRISVGLEDPDDLLADFDRALRG